MYKKIPVKKLTGNEQFQNIGGKRFSVGEFWQYGSSSLNSNIIRGALAEFIVENALKDKEQIEVRNPWGDYDVLTDGNKKVEVKCSAYIQDWDQKELSRIVWTGLKAKELYWSSAVNKSLPKGAPDYKADIYVLALLKHQDPDTLDIFDLDQWCFYVLSRERLEEVANNSSGISLSRLVKFKIKPIHFTELAQGIEALSRTINL